MTELPSNNLGPRVQVNRIERVTNAADISELVRTATAAQSTVVPFGGQRSLGTGNGTHTSDVGIDVRACNGVIAYEPTDLTLSVKTGTTWAEVQATLAANGQELPLDVPYPEMTTVGGVFATGYSGPRRLRSGSLRDLVIGCEYVRGDGLVAKAGGMVVKNVSGFEIPRFLHGSWGSLAILSSINLKVVPIARADGTFVGETRDLAHALSFARSMIMANPTLEAASVDVRNDLATVAIRAIGRDGAVAETLQTVSTAWGPGGSELTGQDSRAFWQGLVDQSSESGSEISVSIACRPRQTEQLTEEIRKALPQARILAMPGYGSIRILGNDVDEASAAAWIGTIGGLLNDTSSMVIDRAPVGVDLAQDAWGSNLDGMGLMRAIKREFDPAAVLNPGRLWI